MSVVEKKDFAEKMNEEMAEKKVETRWLYYTSENFPKLVELSKKTCVIPMGCIEKHGLHLPLGTDILQVSALTYAASQLEPVAVFPDFTFGDVGTLPGRAPGYVGISLELEMRLLEGLCEQIAQNGFEKILVVNGHGGNNSWLDAFSRELVNKKRSFEFAVCPMHLSCPHPMAEYLLANGSGSFPELEKEDEELILKYHAEGMEVGHACMGETAFVMAVAPETVHLERLGIESGKSLHLTDHLEKAGIILRSHGWNINYPNDYSADDPVGTNERIAKAAFRFEAERLAHAFKVMKDEENLMKWHEKDQKRWE